MLKTLQKYILLWIGRRNIPKGIRAGDVCSVRSGDGKFGIVKILVYESTVVHIRIYKQKFDWRPPQVDTTMLSVGTIHDKDGYGIGHIPLSVGEFGLWEPVIIKNELVTEEELEGYKYWYDNKGGVFQ